MISRIWRKLFFPPNSLILTLDHVSPEDEDCVIEALAEVRRHYTWVSLSELIENSDRRKFGYCSLLFTAPRKSILLRAIPLLQDETLPVAVTIYPDLVGTNRLLAEEETFDEKPTPSPIEGKDPQRFLMTWGDCLRIAPRSEWVLGLDRFPKEGVERDITYLARQLPGVTDLLYTRSSAYVTGDAGIPSRIRVIGSHVGAIPSIGPGDAPVSITAEGIPTWPLLAKESR